MKTIAKIIIILAITIVLGRALVNFTTRGSRSYERISQQLQQGVQQLMGRDSHQAVFVESGVVTLSGDQPEFLSGVIIDDSHESVDSAILEERLNYYQSQKSQLRSGADLLGSSH